MSTRGSPEFFRDAHEVRKRGGAHLLHDVTTMDLDGDLADPELRRGLFVQSPVYGPLHHLTLAERQRLVSGLSRPALSRVLDACARALECLVDPLEEVLV